MVLYKTVLAFLQKDNKSLFESLDLMDKTCQLYSCGSCCVICWKDTMKCFLNIDHSLLGEKFTPSQEDNDDHQIKTCFP